MDKQQAKFILQSFRPDGADATDSTFTEALRLAAQDRELGEWLVNERAEDAAFATALNEVAIPAELRLQILAVMRGEMLDDPDAEIEMDEMLFEAFDDVEPPEGLRDQILAAMDVQEKEDHVISISEGSQQTVAKKSGWKRVSGLMSMAAALALGGFLALNISSKSNSLAENNPVRLYDVQQYTSSILNANFQLDVKNSDKEELSSWLVGHQLPAPSKLPVGLDEMKSIGCKQITLPNGRYASLICYLSEGGEPVHVIVMSNKDVVDTKLPEMAEVDAGDCYKCRKTGWDVVRWHDKENAYIMLAKSDPVKDKAILQYF
ncbi:MAG: hypothetical protein ACSHX0_10610 [Akkermansiaceae bacterium]